MPVATTDAFRRITVQPDNVTIVAEQVGDTLTLVAGSGISLVANTASDQITIVNTNSSGANNDPIFNSLTVDGIVIDTNVIRGTDSNANLELTTNGTGAVVVSKLRTTETNVALGSGAGAISQTTGAIAIGQQAGESSQSLAIAIGIGAGQGSQGFMAVALGHGSAVVGQGANGVAIGASAGELNQGSSGIAIGYYAGKTTQESGAVAIGYTTGQVTQRTGAVAIGWSAGQTNQGANAIAIGYRAGFTNQNASSIVLNASGSALEAGAAGLYINPIRPTSTFFKPLMYDTATSEIAYSSVLEFTGSTISTSDSSGITVDVPTTFNSDVSVQNDLNVGRVRFPDSTIQTTAWPGSIPTSIVSSNITVNGTNAYTLTGSPAATPLTITVTPNTATSLITVTFQFTWHPSEPEASGSTGMRLFIYKNGVQQASSEYLVFTSGNGDVYNSYPVHYSWPDVSGTTSPVTYTVYANKTGGNGGTIGMALESKFPCWATIVG